MSRLSQHPHYRYNPLIRQWVLVSPQRTERPWQGQIEVSSEARPPYDPGCYLCPGNTRAGGARNPSYTSTFVFDNDFPALQADMRGEAINEKGLLVARPEAGVCRVVCFSPRHDLSLASMGLAEIRRVVDSWVEQYQSLGALPSVNYVQIFENRGAMMGCSNPHPHCQIWASASIPNEPAQEQTSLAGYRRRRRACLLCDYLALESGRERLVYQNERFAVLVPFWALWPFETLLISRRHVAALDELTEAERNDLARAVRDLAVRYDRLFEVAFPYSMGFHQRPTDGASHREWHLHAHYYPPLLRSATIRKFMVGYEMLATPQRDLTAEEAAARLRSLPGAEQS